MLDRRRLLQAINIMGVAQAGTQDRDVVLALTRAGFTPLEADKLMALVPLAFSRPILEELGVCHLSDTVSAKNRSGDWVQVSLSSQKVYQLALTLAREHRRVGSMDHEVYKALACRCSQIDAASKALNAGADIKGATVAAALLSISAEDLTPESWFSRIRRAIVG